jgi:hypothetical protein
MLAVGHNLHQLAGLGEAACPYATSGVGCKDITTEVATTLEEQRRRLIERRRERTQRRR